MTMLRPRVVLPCLPPLQTAVAEAQGRPAQPLPPSLGQGALVLGAGRTRQQGALQAWTADPAQDLCVCISLTWSLTDR